MTNLTLPMNVLLIDDDEVDRQSVTRALKQSPLTCRITYATTASEGLKLAYEQSFDAILLDYRLPDKDGLDVLLNLRESAISNTAVVMLSHQDDETLAERCLEAGAQDFVLKEEITGRRLSRAVRQAQYRYQLEETLKSSREELRDLSERDPLTGLRNRRGFEIALEYALERAYRSDETLAILLLDLDDFKSVNDTLGHDSGDELLKSMSTRLSRVVREGDCLCRLGGDEFVILMTNYDYDEHVSLLGERIIKTLQNPFRLVNTQYIVTASIGIATLNSSGGNALDLLKFADIAMYQAKKDGRNQMHFYSDALQQAVELRANMKRDLTGATGRNEFTIYYQAQINAQDGSLGGVEALLRWQHPTFGLLLPEPFLPFAEESHMILEIGDWVLHEGCRQLKDWQTRFSNKCPKIAISINLSAAQIKQSSLSTTVEKYLTEFDLDAHSLELEITENALISDTSESVAMLSSIVDSGVSLSLDDFGTGYSSLDHLRQFPISVLKIDKCFVSSVGSNGKDEQLLIAIIAFAKALGMKVVAEGVETKEQAEFCKKYGCDLLQGYYFSRPISATEFEATYLSNLT